MVWSADLLKPPKISTFSTDSRVGRACLDFVFVKCVTQELSFTCFGTQFHWLVKICEFPYFQKWCYTVLVYVYLCPEIMHVTDVIAILKNVPKGPVRSVLWSRHLKLTIVSGLIFILGLGLHFKSPWRVN